MSSAQDFSDQVQLSSAFLRKGTAQPAQLRLLIELASLELSQTFSLA